MALGVSSGGTAAAARAAAFGLALALPRAALAHPGRAPAPHDLWTAWCWEPVTVLGSLALLAWYAAGVRRLWARAGGGRVVSRARASAFAAGVAAVLLALVSPLDAAAEALFSAHMVQHLVLITVAAPLLALGEALLPLLWAFPAPTRRRIGRWWARAALLPAAAGALTAPAVVWVLHVGALLVWHLPGPYDVALRRPAVHAAEHATFLATGVLFWWAVLQRTGRRRLGYGAAVLYVTAASAVMGGLGAILTFARRPWYQGHLATTAPWGLMPLADQQLAGLIMWVPAGVVYLGAALVMCREWLRDDAATDAIELAAAGGRAA
ncbi:hypothetical protein tb265_48140 [Gemmatimonadetes bacterium T265]|nr:hypothetical protein tb265_48140 [Gemmatimonadetes bacterium T265]